MILTVNGKALHVSEPDIRGTEDDPSLLFIHGAGGSGALWEDQMAFFRGRHSAYRLDLPGHGGSDHRGEERISSYAEWVRLGMGKLFTNKPFVLVGHSMGGAVVLELALTPPEGLEGIVVAGSGAKLAVTRAIFMMLRENPETFFESIDQFAFSSASPKTLRERFIRVTRQCPPSVIFGDFQACDHFDIRNRLSEIKIPTLVLCGEQDQLTPVKYSTYLHQNIPGSRLVLIPHAGHLVMAEQADLFNEAVASFLDTLTI